MTKFESSIKHVAATQAAVYAKLSDLNNLAQIKDRLPEDKVKNLTFDADTLSMDVPPAGTVTLTAWLRPAQDGDASENTGTSVLAIDPPLIAGDGAYAQAYGYLDSEDPAPAQSLEALPEPNTDPGSHLSYTFQWIAFSIMILAGLVYAAKRERDAVRRGDRDDRR